MKDPVSNESESSFELMKVFVAFQLFGLFGILITLVTVVFSRSTPRHAAWFSFIISWIISTVAYTLLFWSGHLFSGSEPPFALCLIQGVMIYASPPLTAFTTLALVGQMWYLVHFFEVLFIQTKGKGNQGRPSQKMLIILLVLPYLLFIVIFVGNTILGLQHPSMVKRVSASGMYCTFTNRIPGRISTALCALLLIPVTVLEVSFVQPSTIRPIDGASSSIVHSCRIDLSRLQFDIHLRCTSRRCFRCRAITVASVCRSDLWNTE
ncbi:hypothetical protein H2248_011717 [Termitomyces sp. 'cryptogamus']|nr:hypothetical protein H2248_011717 [Termitomyces sp. 'cryptogamus']